ncbi:unnamed protein product, partial [Amoebophrya sp. A25]
SVYFLLICVLQIIPEISPTGGIATQALPLSIIVLLEVIKAFIETWRRTRADDSENTKKCWRLTTNKTSSGADHCLQPESSSSTGEVDNSDVSVDLEEIEWQHLGVGDIIELHPGDEVPADCILFGAGKDDKRPEIVYVETANLDGEANWKPKRAVQLSSAEVGGNENLNGREEHTPVAFAQRLVRQLRSVEVEAPSSDLYRFHATFWHDSGGSGVQREGLSVDNLLLRGTSLREESSHTHAKSHYALIVYTGKDTRAARNAFCADLRKFSFFDEWVDWIMLRCVLLEVAFCFGMALWNHWCSTSMINHEQQGLQSSNPAPAQQGRSSSRWFYRPL